jgi:hypothetical protein
MKQVIRLTESDLHNIVKKALNELDWRTYQSAYEKNKKPYRGWKFRDAATNAFNHQNGYGLENVPYGYTNNYDVENSLNRKGDFYAGTNTFDTDFDTFDTISGNFDTISGNKDNPKIYDQQHIITKKHASYKPGERGENATSEDKYWPNNATTFNPRLKMAQMKGDKQVRDYFQGKSQYKNGKWQ